MVIFWKKELNTASSQIDSACSSSTISGEKNTVIENMFKTLACRKSGTQDPEAEHGPRNLGWDLKKEP